MRQVWFAGELLRILLAITALLIYGSLYPWQFHAGRDGYGPLHALVTSWVFSANRFALRDIALNIALYIPFGAAAHLWLSPRAWIIRTGAPVLLAAVLSTTIEIAQFYDGQRFTSSVDVATNIMGAALGMVVATFVTRPGKRTFAIRIRHPGPVLLLCCFAGAMLFPLIPDFSRTHLMDKMNGFFRGEFGSVVFYALFTGWLIAAELAQAVVGDGADFVFPLLSLCLPARCLVLGLNAGWMYWASFLAAWFFWVAFLADSRPKHLVLACITGASITLTGLSPFHLALRPQPFNWIPFLALFSTDWETGFAILLRKAFLYGSLVRLFEVSGVRLLSSTAIVAVLLTAIEATQLYLPSHAAELTDPLLAVLMAWLLHRLSRVRRTEPISPAFRNSVSGRELFHPKPVSNRLGTPE